MSITQIYFQCEKKNGQILFREKPLETTYLCPSTLATDLTSLPEGVPDSKGGTTIIYIRGSYDFFHWK